MKPYNLKEIIFAFGGKANYAMKNIFVLACILLSIQHVYAQSDTIELKEANLSDSYLLRFTQTQQTLSLTDSVLDRNQASLTSLLNYNSTIYFKENGLGMVSSPSFRGTTAQQTAVIWNGININSQLNGQTDFNTVNTRGFDNITLKSGGASVAYGSSAIGGSIHLNNDLRFRKDFSNQILLNYGNFNAYGINFNSKYSDENLSLNLGLSRNGSDNDYEFIDKDLKNTNGQFYNQNLSVAAGYKMNSKNILKFYGNLYDGERHFSVPTTYSIKTKYHDYNTRSLVEWNGFYGKFISKLRLAHLGEEYRYFATLNTENPDFGKVNSWIAKYDLGFNWTPNLFLNAVFDFTQNEGNGSEYAFEKRQIGSASFLMKHQINSKLLYELTLRTELTNNYDSPFLYSFGLKYNLTDFYNIRFNTSKNFRIPTFNDLYWPREKILDLKPETSYQAEIGNQIHFKNFSFSASVYYNSVKDFLQWVPFNGGVWQPENTHNVKIYGIESILNYKKSFQNHHFELNGTYAYTVSENEKTGKQLIYVPFHKTTASLGYSMKRLSAYYQIIFNGKVFTDANNLKELDAYTVSNLGIDYGLGKNEAYRIGIQALNLWNENYQSTLNRPMPGRNFNLYLNLKF